jgi:hypothetical protein
MAILACSKFHVVLYQFPSFFTFDSPYFFTCREVLGKILARGHSRVPVYEGSPRNLIGVLLVCN